MGKLITELKTVERPLIKYAKQAGFEYVPPAKALTLRKGESGKLFYSVLEKSLIRLNPDFLNEHNVSTIVQKIDSAPDTIEGNKKNLDWARGHQYFFDTKENRNRNVMLIDFINVENNVFHVTDQWSYKNHYKKNRPDLLFLINGIPFAIVENKKPGVENSMEKAIEQLKRLEKETPEIMSFPQVFNITDALQYYYGVTWNYARKNIFNWKSHSRQITLEEATLAFFNKKHFLKLIKDWILFYYKENELEKTILRQHQTRAVEKIVTRCNDLKKSRALIWHTQGSGKTFTMLTTARLILESNSQATVMIIVDRNELEGQLSIWMGRLIKELKTSGILTEQAHSKKHLKTLLENNFRGLIVSMLHKFKDIPANICNRADVYVFADEAHRSLEGNLGNYLTGALPNATFIGFTGTPIDKTSKGKGTFKIFGKDDAPKGYLDKYSISESIEDGTTVKLKYALSPNKMLVKEELLDKEFFQIAETEGVSNIDTLNKVLKKSVKLRVFLKSSDRVNQISEYIAKHFKENVKPLGYKAFLVAVDREASALYKKALDKHLPPEMSQVVYTKGHNDSELLQTYHLSKDEEASIRKKFKKADQEPQILIVTDKLLTGYDAPILYCMYLDKPMRDHVLLQAIARVNRPYEDRQGREKPCGLIVDFVGVFKSMKKALAFDSDEVDSVIENLDQLLQKFESMMKNNIKPYLAGTEKTSEKFLEKLAYEILFERSEREKFIELFKELETLYEILSPSRKLRPYIDDYKNLAEAYKVIIETYKNKPGFTSDLCKKTEHLIRNSTILKTFSGIKKTYQIDVESLKKLKEGKGLENKGIINLIYLLQQEAREKAKQEPYLIPISERASLIMKNFETKQKNSKETLEEILKLIEEKESAQKMWQISGLSHQECTVAWPLKKQGIKNYKELAVQISESFDKFKQFYNNMEEMRQLKVDMYQVLSEYVSEESLVKRVEEVIDLMEKIRK